MADIEQFVPAESDAAFQQRQSQYLADIFGRSHNYEQAQKDVAAARAMMGSVRVQQLIQKGADPAQAYYSNMHYFVQPNDKGFSGVMQQLRPVPPPYATNFPGISAPVVIAPTRAGQTVHFPPTSVLPPKPTPDIAPKTYDLPGYGKGVYNPKAGTIHPKKESTLTPEEESQLKVLQSQANQAARTISEFSNRPDIATNAVNTLRQATNAIHQIYNKPKGDAGVQSAITTQEQFDALPAGTIYIGKDGRKYRKP